MLPRARVEDIPEKIARVSTAERIVREDAFLEALLYLSRRGDKDRLDLYLSILNEPLQEGETTPNFAEAQVVAARLAGVMGHSDVYTCISRRLKVYGI